MDGIAQTTEFHRIIDKYSGTKFCDLEPHQQVEFLEAVAERGAFNTLKKLGLDDDNATGDIRDIRTMLSSYRIVKKTAMTTIVGAFGRLFGWIVVFVIAGLVIRSNHDRVKALVDLVL